MADVYTIFGTMLAFGIVFPGMLVAWWLFFPARTARAATRIKTAPKRTLMVGLGALVLVSVPIMLLLAIPLPFTSFLAAALAALTLAAATVGAAGLTAQMAASLRESSDLTAAAAYFRAAVALELAAIFPIIGWFIVVPSAIMLSLGAAVYALNPLAGRQAAPRAEARSVSPVRSQAAIQIQVAE